MELCDDVYRFANDEQLTESETCVMEFDKKESTYTMKLTGDVKAKQGKVKVVAKNNGGEASSEADLTTSGRLPELSAKPIKCAVLEGMNRAVLRNKNCVLTYIDFRSKLSLTPKFIFKICQLSDMFHFNLMYSVNS